MIPQDNAQIAVRHRVLGVQLNLGRGKTWKTMKNMKEVSPKVLK